MAKLSNDELRAKTKELEEEFGTMLSKKKPHRRTKSKLRKCRSGRTRKIWQQIDKIEDDIMKNTKNIGRNSSGGFCYNERYCPPFQRERGTGGNSTDFDRELAATHDFVRIRVIKPSIKSLDGGGNEITWDMVHYDVQLFGGVVLQRENCRDGYR